MLMNERLRQARKLLNLTQEKFASRLGIKQNSLSAIEKGRVPLTDRTIRQICSEFNIDFTWLTTGEGEPFPPKSRTEEIVEYATHILQNEPDTFRSRFITALCKLNESDWEVLEKIALSMAEPEPEGDILEFAARTGVHPVIRETPEQKEARRAETLRDLEEIPNYSFDDD